MKQQTKDYIKKIAASLAALWLNFENGYLKAMRLERAAECSEVVEARDGEAE